MKKKLVLVLDVEMDKSVDMQDLTNKLSGAIQSVAEIDVKDFVLFDNDETSADKLIANINK